MPRHHNAAAKYRVVQIQRSNRVAFLWSEQALENGASVLIQIGLHSLP
jgi:hypothetical protein